MADIEGYGDVRPEWLRALARRSARDRNVQHPQRSPRVRTLIRAVIGGDGRPGQDVIVRNVSPGGMCIVSQTLSPSPGETLRVSLPGQGNLKAQVRWVGNGEFGVQLMGGLELADGRLLGGRLQGGRLQEGRLQEGRGGAGFTAVLERLLGVAASCQRRSRRAG